jgi:hypothetical protein
MLSVENRTGDSKMPDKAYENATARREALAKEINLTQQRLEELRSELRGVDTFLDQWRKFSGVPDSAALTLAGPAPSIRRTRENSKKEEVAEAAYEIIASEGRPLPRSELFKKLIKRGLIIEGSDPEVVLSTMLWRMRNRIKRLKKGGYWLADRPWKGGGTDPFFADPEFDTVIGTTDDTPPEGAVETEEETT